MSAQDRGDLTRREAIRLLGAAAAASLLPASDLKAGAAPAKAAPIVRTILRDVPPAQITGVTLIHEHISAHANTSDPAFAWNRDIDLMSDEVRACANDGVSCIVDTGHDDLGRSIDELRTIAQRSGMLIVAGGGMHTKPMYTAETLRKTEQEIAEDLYRLAASERWGVIGEMGTGTGVPMDADERKVLRAAARVHLRTGMAIITHVSGGCAQCALDQVDLFADAGADLTRVVIGHLNDIADQPAAAPLAIAKRGACLGFDHSGKPDDPRLQEYVRTVMTVLDAGYADKVCLSSDFGNQKYLRKNGGPGISMVMTTFVPKLRQAGVDEATLHTILVENPRRVLTFTPKA